MKKIDITVAADKAELTGFMQVRHKSGQSNVSYMVEIVLSGVDPAELLESIGRDVVKNHFNLRELYESEE